VLQDLCEWLGNKAIMVYKVPIISCQPKEAPQLSEILWDMPLQHSLGLCRVSSNSISGNNVAQIIYLLLGKCTFLKLDKKLMLS
jgi:hypothetical protein